jgi:hypothetical protein
MKCMLLLSLLWSWPALAQPADCVARPNGPAVPLEAWVGMPKRARGAIQLDLGAVPANGTTCGDDAVLPIDVLHGAPTPHGLLRGDGPKDVLHDRPDGHVIVTTVPNAPPW